MKLSPDSLIDYANQVHQALSECTSVNSILLKDSLTELQVEAEMLKALPARTKTLKDNLARACQRIYGALHSIDTQRKMETA